MSAFYRPEKARAPRHKKTHVRRLILAGVGLAVLSGAAAAAFLYLRTNPRFLVTRVVLSGVPDARRAEAEELTDRWIGKPLLFVDLDEPVATLSSRPWVARAAARRVVPDTITVEITARPAVAIARRGSELWTVDAAGTFLGPYAGRAVSARDSFVILDAGEVGDPAQVSATLARGAAFLLRLAEDDRALLARLSEIEIRPDGFAAIDQDARVKLLFGPEALEPSRAAAIWRAYLALKPELDRHALGGGEIDLRFSNRIVLAAADAARGKT